MELEDQIKKRKEIYVDIKTIGNSAIKKEQYHIYRAFGVMHELQQKIDDKLFYDSNANAKALITMYGSQGGEAAAGSQI